MIYLITLAFTLKMEFGKKKKKKKKAALSLLNHGFAFTSSMRLKIFEN